MPPSKALESQKAAALSQKRWEEQLAGMRKSLSQRISIARLVYETIYALIWHQAVAAIGICSL